MTRILEQAQRSRYNGASCSNNYAGTVLCKAYLTDAPYAPRRISFLCMSVPSNRFINNILVTTSLGKYARGTEAPGLTVRHGFAKVPPLVPDGGTICIFS